MIDLTPAEILMLHYADTYTDGNNTFQGFWNYRYNISNPKTILNKLQLTGYIAVGDPAYQLQHLSATDIKKLLSDRGLKTTGKKAALIDRLTDNADIASMRDSLPRYYCLTEKGAAAKQTPESDYILYVHRNQFLDDYGLNINNADRIINGNCYQKAIIDYLLFQTNPPYFHIAGMYAEIGDIEKAFVCFITDLRIFLNGQQHQFYDPMTAPVIAASIAKGIFPYETSLLRIPFGRLRPLREVIDKLNYSDEQVQQKIAGIVDQLAASQFFFTDSECVQIIYHELCNDTNTLTAIYQTAEQRYKAKYSLR